MMNNENCKPDTVYNIDYRWPKRRKQISKKPAAVCSICEPPAEDKPVSSEQFRLMLDDFQKLFERFPYLKDILCKMQPHEVRNLLKEKNETTYNYDFKVKQNTDNASNGKNDVDDDDNEEWYRPQTRCTLKRKQIQGAVVGYSGVAPPEPYQVPKSEYRSTIHTLGAKIIKDKLLIPEVKKY